VFNEKFDQARIVSKDIDGPRLDLMEHALVEVLDLVGHAPMLANMQTSCHERCLSTAARNDWRESAQLCCVAALRRRLSFTRACDATALSPLSRAVQMRARPLHPRGDAAPVIPSAGARNSQDEQRAVALRSIRQRERKPRNPDAACIRDRGLARPRESERPSRRLLNGSSELGPKAGPRLLVQSHRRQKFSARIGEKQQPSAH